MRNSEKAFNELVNRIAYERHLCKMRLAGVEAELFGSYDPDGVWRRPRTYVTDVDRRLAESYREREVRINNLLFSLEKLAADIIRENS